MLNLAFVPVSACSNVTTSAHPGLNTISVWDILTLLMHSDKAVKRGEGSESLTLLGDIPVLPSEFPFSLFLYFGAFSAVLVKNFTVRWVLLLKRIHGNEHPGNYIWQVLKHNTAFSY